MMHQQKGKKIFVYLFLFIIFGSINNTSFTKNKFNNIKNIKISGLNENENINLLENIMKLN